MQHNQSPLQQSFFQILMNGETRVYGTNVFISSHFGFRDLIVIASSLHTKKNTWLMPAF